MNHADSGAVDWAFVAAVLDQAEKGEVVLDSEIARICRALLAALDDLEAVKAELHITERLLRSEAETTLELRAANAALTAREGVIAYALQDERNTGDCPRVVDIAYNAFMIAKHPNKEDGGPSDWFTDTRPMVMEKIAEIRAALQHKDATHG